MENTFEYVIILKCILITFKNFGIKIMLTVYYNFFKKCIACKFLREQYIKLV